MVERRPALEIVTGNGWRRISPPVRSLPLSFRPSGWCAGLTTDPDSHIAFHNCNRRRQVRLAPAGKAMDDAAEVVVKILPALMKNAEAAYIDDAVPPMKRASGINLENR